MKLPFFLWLAETKSQIMKHNLNPMAYISALINSPPNILPFTLSFFLPLAIVNSILLFYCIHSWKPLHILSQTR